MSQKILTWSFYFLFFFTPLFFTPLNNELFEYNKMMLVYLLTIIITATWIIKMIQSKKLILNRTPLDIPLLLFLLSQILSTIFSIDPHTSIWGYYSRSNGGLLSIISYLLLYCALVSNFTKEDIPKLLKSILAGGLVTALYAIPEHFGVSPSCIILTQQFTASCWIQDVQARVFATLGQPNWLAAYLGMLIFPCIYFVLTAKKFTQTLFYGLLIILYYMAFTFTYSRGATLGVIAGLIVFSLGYVYYHLEGIKPLLSLLLVFLLINLLFGSALTGFRLIKQSIPPRPAVSLSTSSITQLETGGTESGSIRLIVWKGALDIFKHYPILGSGVETFAYSYYNFRPVAHNLVSEWDFLYNKAHNEYLNYLATTGLVGFLSYSAVIITFLVWSIKIMNKELRIKQGKLNSSFLLLISLLAGYTSYLVQNFFGFSVVMIALLFYISPALAFVAADKINPVKLPKKLSFLHQFVMSSLYKRPVYQKLATLTVILVGLFFVSTLVRFWFADTLYKLGLDYLDSNPGRSYNYLAGAVRLNPDEPLYKSDLGFAAAQAAGSLAEKDATVSASVKEQAVKQTDSALRISPKNLSILRTTIRTYYQLAAIDPQFQQKTLDVANKAIAEAPTDPKLYYNKGLVLSQFGNTKDGVEALKKAIELKPNYREAHFTLSLFYEELKQKDLSIEEMQFVLKLVPNDPDAIKKLQELQI